MNRFLNGKNMELKEAIQILKSHNEWRREERDVIGHGLKMTDPKKLGIAIDIVVNEFENLFISGVSPSLRLASNDEIRYSFQSTENERKPYGTTDGYINTLRGELRLNGLEIYVSNEG